MESMATMATQDNCDTARRCHLVRPVRDRNGRVRFRETRRLWRSSTILVAGCLWCDLKMAPRPFCFRMRLRRPGSRRRIAA